MKKISSLIRHLFDIKEKSYFIYAGLTIALSIVFVALFANGLLRYYPDYDNSAKMGKNVIYSISQDKIISDKSIRDIAKEPEAKPIIPESSQEIKHVDSEPSNQQPLLSTPTRPMVAILVEGVGLSSSSTEAVEKLPPSVTLGLSPYAPDVAILAKKLSDSKYDLFINMPLEPTNYPEDDPGPYGLLTSLTDADNIERLNFLLNKASGILGVYTSVNEKFTSNESAIKPVLDELKNRKLLYVYAGDDHNIVIGQVANHEKFNLINIDYNIDQEITEENITKQLDLALKKAKEKGFATIAARPYPISIFHLQKWIESLPDQNVDIVGFAQIAKLTKE